LTRGSDERQYCAPGVDLPVCSVMRTKYGMYPEYHTSGDDLNFVTPKALEETFEIYKKIIIALENNKKYKINCLCEPQLGKRGLYPTISIKDTNKLIYDFTNFIAYCDGNNDLIDISNIIGAPASKCIEFATKLLNAGLINDAGE